ncbi:fatty acid desaturase [Bdellovibrio sp. NC01]|uniref:fatty acid desaturase family protein n=1 Tax=Bdellovibrio sp. NC01 TaxID=2220073 RepID=UPI001157F200|nr:fatty acid desaturase [Bdellovibrio sp. NC01]QDK38642.1 hypothetical protein DOE51_14150 [Bdellovibrio sp. NC01]
MLKEDFKATVVKYHAYKSNTTLAIWTLSRVIALTAMSVVLSLSSMTLVWLVGQCLFAIAVLQWFVLLHDFGHNVFFKSGTANWIWGHVASIFCLVPFTPWKFIHAQHHTWTGWQDKDPTMESTLPQNGNNSRRKVARFAWRWWIPVLAISFSVKNFWNMPRLFRLFPRTKERWQFVFSFLVMQLTFWVIFPHTPHIWKIWTVGYLLFLVIADPLLISQHSHVPQKIAGSEEVRPVPVYEQDQFTRTLFFPPFVSKYILLSFDAHGPHHIWPKIPCYFLPMVKVRSANDADWYSWLKEAKALPADQILFSNREETGWNI